MTNLSNTSLIQVTNVAPTTTTDQMTTFFSFIGPIDEIVLYPKDDNQLQSQSKTCYVKFRDASSVKVAQHLSNTVFIDRALIVQPVFDDRIPDESTSHSLTSGLNAGNNEGLINQVVTSNNGLQVISTIDPRLSALGLPQYPALPSNTDPSKIEEIRRTVQVTNLDPNVTAEDVLRFFNQIGEIKYVRLNSTDNLPPNLQTTKFALVEFTEQSSVASALQSNGSLIGGFAIKVSHSTQAIIKPLASRNSNTQQKEIEETMKRVRDSQLIEQPGGVIKLDNINILQLSEHSKNMIAAVAASNLNDNLKRSSRSTSRPRRSISRERRRRSRSRDSYRRRYDDRYSSRRSRERSKERYSSRRSPRRSPRRSHSPSRRSPRNDRDRDSKHERRHRDSSREKERSRRDRSKSSERRSSRRKERDYRDRSKDRERHSRRSKERSSRDGDSSSRRREKDRERIREEEMPDLSNKDSRLGPSTPPDAKLDNLSANGRSKRGDEKRRSISRSPSRKKHSKEKRKRKERKESEDESDNSQDNDQEMDVN